MSELVLAALAAVGFSIGARAAGAQEPQPPRDRVSERVLGERPSAERMLRAVQERLGLSEAQTRRLGETTGQFATQRQQLFRRERTLRRDLREQLSRGQSADQARVGQLLDELLGMQRRRADMVVAEQRALADFLTPVQRAEFMALQERAFRAAQQMREQREGRGDDEEGGRGGPGGPPGGGPPR
ncbi:hypothetical protein [Roseisolibacter sp. H3M3-2]|uniref:hypothetical protein n=1 Tax=Roseisolibacter sp. H3M3-2 TaxID=3031323 RepID=UPI0023DB92AB|nr:hypothetical protein [Roseisolibacter sp. H3M3-2]MDF1503705.1 hypothetical protein [Roseisolibacter sp. H3M3-2]